MGMGTNPEPIEHAMMALGTALGLWTSESDHMWVCWSSNWIRDALDEHLGRLSQSDGPLELLDMLSDEEAWVRWRREIQNVNTPALQISLARMQNRFQKCVIGFKVQTHWVCKAAYSAIGMVLWRLL